MNHEPEDDYRQKQEAYEQQMQDDYERDLAELKFSVNELFGLNEKGEPKTD